MPTSYHTTTSRISKSSNKLYPQCQIFKLTTSSLQIIPHSSHHPLTPNIPIASPPTTVSQEARKTLNQIDPKGTRHQEKHSRTPSIVNTTLFEPDIQSYSHQDRPNHVSFGGRTRPRPTLTIQMGVAQLFVSDPDVSARVG